MSKSKFTFESLVKECRKQSGIEYKTMRVEEKPIVIAPYMHYPSNEHSLAIAANFLVYPLVNNPDDPSVMSEQTPFLVTLFCFDDKEENDAASYRIYCGDPYLLGLPELFSPMKEADMLDIAQDLQKTYNLKKDVIVKNYRLYNGTLPTVKKKAKSSGIVCDASCEFPFDDECSHVNAVLSYIGKKEDFDVSFLLALRSSFETFQQTQPKGFLEYCVNRFLDGYTTPSLLLLGATGVGKTFQVRKLAKENESKVTYFEIPCNSTMEEDALLGRYIPAPGGSAGGTAVLVWQDGIITEAFRHVQTTGGKAIIGIDEIGRLSTKMQNLFINIINPFDEMYTIRTDKVTTIVGENEIATMEKIAIPCDKIMFVATSNIGQNYTNVDMSDDALIARFVQVPIDDDVQNILQKVLSKNALLGKNAKEIIKKCILYYEKVKSTVNSELYSGMKMPSARFYDFLVQLTTKREEDITVEQIKDMIEKLNFSITAIDPISGKPVYEQTESLTKIANEVFV